VVPISNVQKVVPISEVWKFSSRQDQQLNSFMISFRKLVILPESGRPVTRKTRVKTSPAQTDDPMRATEGGETQPAAAAATSTTDATEEEEKTATPLIIICSVPSRYYYTHLHHHRRARDFLVSQFRWLLLMRAKHGKQPI
jgi:hypothetical protein